MATSVNSCKVPCQLQTVKQVSNHHSSNHLNFDTIVKSSSNTLKRNPKMELSKPDLIKLLSYLEGELQARDIVIATLKCEKMKYMLKYGLPKPTSISDPVAALCRDNFTAQTGSFEPYVDFEQQMNPIENLVAQQRKTLVHMAKIFKEAELRHQKVIQELMAFPKKRSAESSSNDYVLNGIGEERSQLKQDLELERQAKKRLEGDLKTISDVSGEDKMRQKQIVLLLLAERKKIVMKYIEERKRSEDLAQILSEEKSRIDSMAEGLEEESKKSLQMEAELEKQIAQFDTESQILRTNLIKEGKRVKELESELERVRNEAALYEKQLTELQQLGAGQTNTILPNRSSAPVNLRLASSGHSNNTIISNVAKVVQPTATVSSVPVTGPTTGVARSIPPSQTVRGIAHSPPSQSPLAPSKVEKRPNVTPVSTTCKSSPNPAIPSQVTVGTNGGSEKKVVVARGAPPPVPPNKPVLPPKKDTVFKRPEANICNNDLKNKKDSKPCPSESSEVSNTQSIQPET